MPQTSLKIAVHTAALSPDLRRSAPLAQAGGFAGLLIDAVSHAHALLELSGTGRREIRHLLARYDQSLVGLDIHLPREGFGPRADIDRTLNQLERLLDVARGLAAEVVCIDLGPLPPPPATPQPPRPRITPQQAGLIIIPDLAEDPAPPPQAPRKADPAFAASLADALRHLGNCADRHGVSIAFRSSLAGFAGLGHALGSVDCPWFGIDLDPVAALADDWPIDEIFSHLGPLVRHVRGRDATLGDNRRTKPAAVGQGNTDWPALRAALDDAAFTGWVTVDPVDLPDRTAAAGSALAYLRALR